MYRLLLVIVLIAVVVGCKKKSSNTSSGEETTTVDTTLYTIKITKKEKGTKWQITRETAFGGYSAGPKGNELEKVKLKAEYLETVLAIDKHIPTKLTRTYHYARQTDESGIFRDLTFSGKTVQIEKSGSLYTFAVNGQHLSGPDAAMFSKEFNRGEHMALTDADKRWFPEEAVRIGEKWNIPLDDEKKGVKAKVTGELTKAYHNQAGIQCGLLTFDGELSLPKEPNTPRKLTFAGTREGPIDGTSGEAKTMLKITTIWIMNDPKERGEVVNSFEIASTETVRGIK